MAQRVAIIGHTGFVGTYVKQLFPHASCYHTKNIHDIKQQTFDLVINCGIPAKKWLANKEPEQDWNNIQTLLDCIERLETAQFVHISTIDVFDNNHFDQISQEPYGKHRRQVEDWLTSKFGEKLIIIRLGALFGFGLRKNILYDLIHNKQIQVHPQSCFQWYNMEWFAHDLQYTLKQQHKKEWNWFCEPLTNEELFCDIYGASFDTQLPLKQYDLKPNDGYWRSKQACLHSIHRYLQCMMTVNNVMISSLSSTKDISNVENDFHITSKEVVPHQIFGDGFIHWPLHKFDMYRDQKFYSFQSLFYPHTWNLQTDFDIIALYLLKLIDIACYLGVEVLVFGAPKLRSCSESEVKMTKLLTVANEYIGHRNVFLCLEPNARHYQCTFLTNAQETYTYVQQLDLKHICFMMDTGNMHLEGESEDLLFQYADKLRHVHFSAPNLIALSHWPQRYCFSYLRKRLMKLGYKHKFTMECLHLNQDEVWQSIYLIMKQVDVSVIGLGWYGCHSSQWLLEQGLNVQAYEKQHIFSGVSSNNQNRLHLGFHYPRSFKTRVLCQENYQDFLKQYGFAVRFVNHNDYVVSEDSSLDYQTFVSILTQQGLEFTLHQTLGVEHVDGNAICVKEGVIDFALLKDHFTKQLKRITELVECKQYQDLHPDHFVLDCTYNHFNRIPDTHTEPSVLLIYRSCYGTVHSGLTVMDGPFFSLYPLRDDLVTLTHVALGRTLDFDLDAIEADVTRYLPHFKDDFIFEESIVVQKCLMNSQCASRELQTYLHDRCLSVVCGKITGIFQLEDLLSKILV